MKVFEYSVSSYIHQHPNGGHRLGRLRLESFFQKPIQLILSSFNVLWIVCVWYFVLCVLSFHDTGVNALYIYLHDEMIQVRCIVSLQSSTIILYCVWKYLHLNNHLLSHVESINLANMRSRPFLGNVHEWIDHVLNNVG